MCIGGGTVAKNEADLKAMQDRKALEHSQRDGTSSDTATPSRTLLTTSRSRRKSPADRLNVEYGRGGKKRTNVFDGIGRVAKSLITKSPTYQVISGLTKTYKGD